MVRGAAHQSLPYLAAVTVSVVAAFPARAAALPAPAPMRTAMMPELLQLAAIERSGRLSVFGRRRIVRAGD